MRFLFLLLVLFSFTAASEVANAPEVALKTKKATIKTSAICGMCKKTIEKALYALEGVEKAELDVVTKKVKVKYDPDQVDLNTLRQAISAAGYAADDVPARKKAFDKLAECCKMEGACEAGGMQ